MDRTDHARQMVIEYLRYIRATNPDAKVMLSTLSAMIITTRELRNTPLASEIPDAIIAMIQDGQLGRSAGKVWLKGDV